MIRTVLKTIAAGIVALSANSVSATTIGQVAGPAEPNDFAFATGDIGTPGTLPSVGELVTGFDLTLNVPGELRLLQILDGSGAPNAGYSISVDGGSPLNGVGSAVLPSTPFGASQSIRILGFVANVLDVNTYGIDILNLIFATSGAGNFDVSFTGSYTRLLGFSGSTPVTGTTSIDDGQFRISVVDPNVIPLPAGGILLITGAGALIALRRRKQAA